MTAEQRYDLIGDTHGHADELEEVLQVMGYVKKDGVYRHPDGIKAIFLGDFVDRGPQQARTITMARRMVQSGYADAVLGNHEFNGICYAMENGDGGFIRPHTEKNIDQHADFLREFDMAVNPGEYRDVIEWFKTLPVYLDFEHFRVIHACWHEPSLEALRPFLDGNNALTANAYAEYDQNPKGDFYTGVETLIKSPEYPLPGGISFQDVKGVTRTRSRLAWWAAVENAHEKLLAGVEDLTEDQKAAIDADPLMETFNAARLEKPVFIGHFQLDRQPGPLADGDGHVICLDFKGCVTAYRWDGPGPVSPENFVHVRWDI